MRYMGEKNKKPTILPDNRKGDIKRSDMSLRRKASTVPITYSSNLNYFLIYFHLGFVLEKPVQMHKGRENSEFHAHTTQQKSISIFPILLYLPLMYTSPISPCLHNLRHHRNKHACLSRKFLTNSKIEGRIFMIIKVTYPGIGVGEKPVELNKNTKEKQL